MELKQIKNKVERLVDNHNAIGAHKYYREVIRFMVNHVNVSNKGWEEYIETLHPLVELSKKGETAIRHEECIPPKNKKKKNKHKKK